MLDCTHRSNTRGECESNDGRGSDLAKTPVLREMCLGSTKSSVSGPSRGGIFARRPRCALGTSRLECQMVGNRKLRVSKTTQSTAVSKKHKTKR